MSILYELEFDLDGFIESMEKQHPARRRIEDHLEKRRLREQLKSFEDEEPPRSARPTDARARREIPEGGS